MKQLFAHLKREHFFHNLSANEFGGCAAHFLATLNAIHPFREGNGRTQTTFLFLLADRAGHPLDLDRLVPEHFLQAMVTSFEGDERPLARGIAGLFRQS